jgi:hypothetical protein
MLEKINKIISNKIFLIAILLFIALIFRIPFLLSNIDFNNDAGRYSDNFTYNYFDGSYSIQSPGYLSYIYLGRVINSFINNPVMTQHIINIILIILIAISFFNLLELFKLNLINCFFITVFFILNNVLLLGSLTGGNRMFLILASIVLMHLTYRICVESKTYCILLFSFCFAFIAGFRQDILAYFVLLYLYNIYKIKNIKYTLLSFLVFILTYLTWFIPLVFEYGGIKAYILTIITNKSAHDTSLIFTGFKLSPLLNIARVFLYTFFSTIVLLPLFIFQIIKKQINFEIKILIILILTFIPPFLFQLFIHNGNFVHISCFLTPLIVFILFNFNIDNFIKVLVSAAIIILLLLQFYGLQMFDDRIPVKIEQKYFNEKILNKINNLDDKDFVKKSYFLKDNNYYLNLIDINKDEERRLTEIFYSADYKIFQRLINILFLQFTYDGARKGRTYRLRNIKIEYELKRGS